MDSSAGEYSEEFSDKLFAAKFIGAGRANRSRREFRAPDGLSAHDGCPVLVLTEYAIPDPDA